MPLDLHKLTNFPIPQPTQTVTPTDMARYALSVGFGHDPLDVRQLMFVDPAPDMMIAPTVALVLAHPGFWMAHPESGVDARSVLHADQLLEMLNPIPSAGTFRSFSKIVGVVDKGKGKAALVRTETVIETDARLPIARLVRTTFIRGAGGFGGTDEAPAVRREASFEAPLHKVDQATRPEQALLYRLSGDLNPLHSDPAVARTAGFDRPILHGLCTMGIIGHAILRALANYEPGRLKSMRLRFTGTVFPGETIRTELWSDGHFRARVVERDAVVVDEGYAEIVPVAAPDRSDLVPAN